MKTGRAMDVNPMPFIKSDCLCQAVYKSCPKPGSCVRTIRTSPVLQQRSHPISRGKAAISGAGDLVSRGSSSSTSCERCFLNPRIVAHRAARQASGRR